MRSIHPHNFITIASIGFEICSRQKSRINKKKRAITQNLGKLKLRFMCTTLPLAEIYPPTKFHNHSLFSLKRYSMHRKKSKYKKKQRAITQKKKASKSYGSYALYSTLIRSIHPQNFITIASIVFEICTRQNSRMKVCTIQNSSMKVNKGQ